MAPAAVAELEAALEKKKRGVGSLNAAMRRMARQLDDLELSVTSFTSQTRAQIEKIGASEDVFNSLVSSGRLTIVEPKPSAPRSRARETREAKVKGPSWADEAEEEGGRKGGRGKGAGKGEGKGESKGKGKGKQERTPRKEGAELAPSAAPLHTSGRPGLPTSRPARRRR